MGIAALVAWLVTALLGFSMLLSWVSRGGVRAAGGDTTVTTRFPAGLVFGHMLLAAAGLVMWIVYLLVEQAALAWSAFGILVIVAVGGDVLFVRWWRGRDSGDIESGLPRPVVYGHGLVAVSTVVLVLLTALGVGTG